MTDSEAIVQSRVPGPNCENDGPARHPRMNRNANAAYETNPGSY